jgi:hypothetical protein
MKIKYTLVYMNPSIPFRLRRPLSNGAYGAPVIRARLQTFRARFNRGRRSASAINATCLIEMLREELC